MSRAPRDRDADRAAAERLLTGTPLHSATGKLTGSELIVESGLRRDVVYGSHRDLVQEFQARIKAQQDVPAAVEKVNAENLALKDENATLKRELADRASQEQDAGEARRRTVAGTRSGQAGTGTSFGGHPIARASPRRRQLRSAFQPPGEFGSDTIQSVVPPADPIRVG
jgi:hypothetical protein